MIRHNRTTRILLALTVVTTLCVIPAMPAGATDTPADETSIWAILDESTLVRYEANGFKVFEFSGRNEVALVPGSGGTAWTTESQTLDKVHLDACGTELNRVPDLQGDTLAVDERDGSLWTGDSGDPTDLVKLDAVGLEQVRVPALISPYTLVTDPSGNLWVNDQQSAPQVPRRVLKFDDAGNLVFATTTPGHFSNAPQQMSIDPRDSSLWYGTGSSDTVIHRSAAGALVRVVSGFDSPFALGVDPSDGSVWVTNYNVSVVKIDAAGNELFSLSLPGAGGLAVDRDGSAWVGSTNALVHIDADGNEIGRIVTEGKPTMVAVGQVADVCAVDVAVDIKPGSDRNVIKVGRPGVIPVAILSTSHFDATAVDPLTVAFGPGGASEAHDRGHVRDVDRDGYLDMVLHFRRLQAGISLGDTEACLTGETTDGTRFLGCDSVLTK